VPETISILLTGLFAVFIGMGALYVTIRITSFCVHRMKGNRDSGD